MDGTVLNAAQRLQQQLEKLDPSKHRDSLVWAHGFLTSLIERLELRMPDLVSSQTRLQSLRANLDELLQRNADLGDASHDSLERLMDDIDPGEAPVPAKRKPSPKGRSGGAAAQPPESELPM